MTEDDFRRGSRWYVRRLGAMSATEIVHRLTMLGNAPVWRRRYGACSGFSSIGRRLTQPLPGDDWHAKAVSNAGRSTLLEEAERYLRREWLFFDLEGTREPSIDWHRDPRSGAVAPKQFAFDIDHRRVSIVGDVKVTWEKNRHHHLTALAAAFLVTREERFSEEVAQQLNSWVEQNPPLCGVNWSHPLECGIRLLAWVWCERCLRGSVHHQDLFGLGGTIWDAAWHQQWLIARTYSRGSSANNHVIGEMAGLFVAATAWPVFHESSNWQQLARRMLERELPRQTFPSGLNREQASGYQLFVLECVICVLVEARLHGIALAPAFRDAGRRMAEAVWQLSDVAGKMSRVGDDDDGRAIQLQARSEPRVPWILGALRGLENAAVPNTAHQATSAAIMGLEVGPRLGEVDDVLPGSVGFEDAGMFLLTTNRRTAREVFVVADAGPHGLPTLAAHAHADALSFTLSVGGEPVLVDPGTFTYHADWIWRQYFRSTRAHNTATVDGLEQSIQAGPFLWASQARTRLLEWQTFPTGGGHLIAEHDGYKRIGVTHRRAFCLRDTTLEVVDEFLGAGEHEVAIRFHLASTCEAMDISDEGAVLRAANCDVVVGVDTGAEAKRLRAQVGGGWYSPRFGVREPTTTLIFTCRSSLPATHHARFEVLFR